MLNRMPASAKKPLSNFLMPQPAMTQPAMPAMAMPAMAMPAMPQPAMPAMAMPNAGSPPSYGDVDLMALLNDPMFWLLMSQQDQVGPMMPAGPQRSPTEVLGLNALPGQSNVGY